jgi:cyclic pyranopterin phosphate synthase
MTTPTQPIPLTTGTWLPPTTEAPPEGPLIDTFGRVADDLRVSVTDRCNFRCTYCMPAEGLAWLPKEEILTFEEMTRLLGIFVGLGVQSIKVTGGEPTVRADLPRLVQMFRQVGPELDISITTNGMLLDRLAAPLAEAGVDRATVSCDSLMRHRFAEMTRRDALDKVLAGLKAAEAAGLTPIKINTVVIGGTNDDEIVDFAGWARETGFEVRFIEYMPLDAEHKWERDKVVPAARILDTIDAAFPLVSAGHGTEPATSYRFADGAPGGIGVIASVTEPFCDTCNRLRITAEGQVRSCLFALEETDLRDPMRAGASNEELAALIRQNVWRKWSGHRINHPDFVQPERSMSMIGG